MGRGERREDVVGRQHGSLVGPMTSKPPFFLKDDQKMDEHKTKTTARALQFPISKTVETEMASFKVAFDILTG